MIDLVSDEEDESSPDGVVGNGTVFPPALAETEALAKRGVPSSAAASGNKDVKVTVPSVERGKASVGAGVTENTQRKAPTTAGHPYLHADGTWTCPTCTLNNTALATRCEACDGLKPIDESVGWRCEFCYEYGSEHGFWMCRNCGAIRKQ